jgi:hypothetical protein
MLNRESRGGTKCQTRSTSEKVEFRFLSRPAMTPGHPLHIRLVANTGLFQLVWPQSAPFLPHPF